MSKRRTQRGAALLLAMLTVTLVATFAATALWQQWRAVEVEQAERARSQSAWVLVGAQDWGRLILREDGRASKTDHLAEPWAVALQESRLSTFLAAERGVSQGDDEGLPEVFLSGRITDMQSRLNINNLVDDKGVPQLKPRQAFKRLFDLLGLPPSEFARLIDNLARASQPQLEEGADAPLRPQRFDQLVWLGLSPATLRVLQPHATLLPPGTTVNLNTASAQVIAAALEDGDLAAAERLVQARARSALRDVGEAARLLEREGQFNQADFSVNSSYFEIYGRLRMEGSVVSERSLVHRNGSMVTTVWRERIPGDVLP
jgi:general secretion pathway protein K